MGTFAGRVTYRVADGDTFTCKHKQLTFLENYCMQIGPNGPSVDTSLNINSGRL